jgi:peptide chain release factor 1
VTEKSASEMLRFSQLRDLLAQAEAKRAELEVELSDPAVHADGRRAARLGREFNRLAEAARLGERFEELQRAIEDDRAAIDDPDLAELAKEELEGHTVERDGIADELESLLAPRDPLDDRRAIVEVRAGTGGEEAALFATDLFRMYTKYAEDRSWKTDVLSSNPTQLGGFKEIVFAVEADGSYGALKYESGVHRVQRVPETESSGRIHTSAASVAVLPEAEEVDVEIDPNDLQVDVYRSSGPGGQSVNTTDSAVRITHKPSGLVVTCQDEKSQLKNKNKAMKVLRARVLERERQRRQSEQAQVRRSLVGSGDRSVKIRTYNFPQNRVTDHRINMTVYNLDEVLAGAVGPFIRALSRADRSERLRTMGKQEESVNRTEAEQELR